MTRTHYDLTIISLISHQALTRNTDCSSSAKAIGRSSSDHHQGLPDLFDLLDGLAQGKEAG